ncbi:hypothetical protein BU24DRAFT_35309 [Aaosphaeria arxii CBS 175.79]|uniref:Uncharacterized protein n=1 Tax=Aaosphaeria arxii CBS 175.79 TaxID=1450172 RepID=A0A6A5YBM5_9PLEO|nr:uncharacterized protein BU24DRAFT_35309 [Aaosphaeria arxii CBS 175.79]KAF2022004.1 hypothetical protein BU24DRAFT_35309 [Aaosphaeria arxii CBS 175.79]
MMGGGSCRTSPQYLHQQLHSYTVTPPLHFMGHGSYPLLRMFEYVQLIQLGNPISSQPHPSYSCSSACLEPPTLVLTSRLTPSCPNPESVRGNTTPPQHGLEMYGVTPIKSPLTLATPTKPCNAMDVVAWMEKLHALGDRENTPVFPQISPLYLRHRTAVPIPENMPTTIR